MGLITNIEQQKNKNRVSIFVDSSFFCGLEKETAIIFGLKIGKEIDEKTLLEAAHTSEVKRAFEKGTSYISTRPHSKFEIVTKLKNKGFSDNVIDDAILKLEEYHFIDDSKFAELFVSQNSKLSKKAIYSKLIKKGISRDIIEYNLSELDEDSEFDSCFELAERFSRLNPIKTYKDRQKLIAKLIAKGFSYSVAIKAFKKLDISDEDNDFDGSFDSDFESYE